MIHPEVERRPSAFLLIKHPVLLTAARMNADQLRVELNAERFKNALLQKYDSCHAHYPSGSSDILKLLSGYFLLVLG